MSISKFVATIENEFNKVHTENGAWGYKTTGHALPDFFYKVSSYRSLPTEEIVQDFQKVVQEEGIAMAARLLFYCGDIRQGIGERRLFNTVMYALAKEMPLLISRVIDLIPEYTRWDYLLPLLQTPCRNEVWTVIDHQLRKDIRDMENLEPISLLGKWLPSANTSSADTRKLGREVAAHLGLTPRKYRKLLTRLRAYLKVVECDMTAGRWDSIDYSTVPSKANLIYGNAFMEHDPERRKQFLDALVAGSPDVKINAGVLFPYDIVHKYRMGWGPAGLALDPSLEALWKALPDYTEGLETGSTLCVVDGSGSMTCTIDDTLSQITSEDVARSLALYFAPRLKGPLKDKFITFSENPQWVDLSNASTLHDRFFICDRYTEYENTNIAKTFDLILQMAIKGHLTQEDLPANLLILSDMEFDCCTDWDGIYYGMSYQCKDTPMEVISRKWASFGYKLPRLVFWNICSRTGAIPVRENQNGVALVSGFNPSIAKMVFSTELDPVKLIKDQLMSPRYDIVEQSIRG